MDWTKAVGIFETTDARLDMIHTLQSLSEIVSAILPVTSSSTAKNLLNFAGTMDTARKLLRLFETLREFSTFMKLYKNNAQSTKHMVLLVGQGIWMAYWLIENLFILAKLKILPLDSGRMSKLTVWAALFAYLATMAVQHLNLQEVDAQLAASVGDSELEAKQNVRLLMLKRKFVMLTIIKESADSFGLLPGLGFIRRSPLVNFLSSFGGLVNGVLSLYLKYC